MKTDSVLILRKDFAAGVGQLLASLDRDDVLELTAQVERLALFRDLAKSVVGYGTGYALVPDDGAASGCTPRDVAHVMESLAKPGVVEKLIDRLKSDDLVEAAPPAPSVAVLDDAEADRADPGPYPSVPATDATQPDDEASDREESAAHRELHAPPVRSAESRRAKVLAVLKVLADGPQTPTGICERTGIKHGTMGELLTTTRGDLWKRGPKLRDPYAITDAGRAYLTEAGFVVAPAPVPKPAPIIPPIIPAPSHEVGGTLPAPKPKPAPVADVDRGRIRSGSRRWGATRPGTPTG